MASSKLTKIDIVVFGATGDTGRCCSSFLFNNAKRLNIESWAPAARNLPKLNRLMPTIFSADSKLPELGVRPSQPIKADVNDYESLLHMAKQAKVLVTCAGPFAVYGENVVKACVEAGCDYVDITGETPWVNLMAKKYGVAAKENGVSVLSQSAYDSVPSDITVALAAKLLREKGEIISRAETHHSLSGGALPSGTLKTLIKACRDGRGKALHVMTGGMWGKTNGTKVEQKPKLTGNSLVPKAVRKDVASSLRANQWWAHSSLSGWTLPGFMAVVNTPIVYTTGHVLNYGDQFTYRERLGANDTTWLSLYGFVPVMLKLSVLTVGLGIALPLLIPMFMLFPDTVSNAAESLNNWDPGSAKTKAFAKLCNGFRPNGKTAVKAIADSVSGKAFAEVDLESDYDAGLGFTAMCALTVAAAILDKRRNGETGNGFETAVVGVGPERLEEWLMKAGVRMKSDVRAKL